MRMNERMRSDLGPAGAVDFAKGEKLSAELSRVLDQGFTDLDGTIIFTAMRNIAEQVKPENFADKTAFVMTGNSVDEDGIVSSCRVGVSNAAATSIVVRVAYPSELKKKPQIA